MKLGVDAKAKLLFAAVVVVGAASVAAWYLVRGSEYTTYRIETHDPVSGLIADAPVEYHGVDVGRVVSVELADSRTVRVLMRIHDGAPVTRATVATITARGVATRGFTGYVYVALEDAGGDFRPLVARSGERYAEIPITPSHIESLDLAMSEVNGNVRYMTGLLKDILDRKTIASLKDSVESLQRVSKTLADNNERLGALIANGDRLSRELQPLVQSSQDTVRALQTQVLPEAHRALTSLDDLSTSLKGFAAKVDRDPSVIVRGAKPPAPGPGETR